MIATEKGVAEYLKNSYEKLKNLNDQRLHIAKQWTDITKAVFRKINGDMNMIQDTNFMRAVLDINSIKVQTSLDDVYTDICTTNPQLHQEKGYRDVPSGHGRRGDPDVTEESMSKMFGLGDDGTW